MIKPNTQIEPLREDLGRIITGSFLTSTSYKRWIVSKRKDEINKLWEQCLLVAKRDNLVIGFGSDEYEANNALTLLLNTLFKQGSEMLVFFLNDLLHFYQDETKERIDVSDLRLDMKAAGIEEDLIKQLNDIGKDETATEEIKPVALTGEQKVRQLEDNYKEVSKGDRNSRKSIEAYLEWHKETLLYLSCYYSDMNSDFKEFKNLDNSGNGHSLYSNFNKINSSLKISLA